MKVELTEQEINWLITACDLVVRNQGLNVAGAALTVVGKLQAATQPPPEPTPEG